MDTKNPDISWSDFESAASVMLGGTVDVAAVKRLCTRLEQSGYLLPDAFEVLLDSDFTVFQQMSVYAGKIWLENIMATLLDELYELSAPTLNQSIQLCQKLAQIGQLDLAREYLLTVIDIYAPDCIDNDELRDVLRDLSSNQDWADNILLDGWPDTLWQRQALMWEKQDG